MKTTFWDNLRQSLYNYIDNELLKAGAYTNIVSGQKNNKGKDLSLFYPVSDTTLFPSDGHVWQSAFHNFVYQSNIQNTPAPSVISGVYIDGVFTPKGNNLHIDYMNGRIMLNSPISTSSIVQADFSYKEYSFIQPTEDKNPSNYSHYKDNSKIYLDPIPAETNSIHIPALFIELDDASEVGFQFGGTHESLPIFKVTILTNNQNKLLNFASIITNLSTKSIPIVDSNLGPKFDFYGDLSESYNFSNWCLQESGFAWVKSVNYNRFYDSSSQNIEPTLFGGFLTLQISAIR